ncbi:MAG: hypothetical protein GXY44_04815, partial [Phycisphaerales bacterium]|nr:hypothetical protein [Phycisphaerales bacterium]
GCQRVAFIRVKCLNGFADGINPVCSQDVLYDGVLIENSTDDPITLKNQSMVPDGPPCGYLTQNIIITNTIVRNTSHPAIKFGTGTAGVFRNILISNCTFEQTGSIFSIQLMRPDIPSVPERVIENVTFSNIVVRNSGKLFDITSLDVVRPVIRNLSVSNIIADGVHGMSQICGLPGAPIQNVDLSNIRVRYAGSACPLWLEADWVQDLRMNNIRLDLANQVDSAFSFTNGGAVELRGVNITGLTNQAEAIRLDNIDGFAVYDSVASSVDRYVQVGPAGANNLSFSGMDFRHTKVPVSAGLEIPAGGVFPVARNIRYSDLSASPRIKPNEVFQAQVTLANEGESGFARVELCVDGKVDGGKWLWLDRDEIRSVELATSAYYVPGEYPLSISKLTVAGQVLAAPAAFEYGERMEVVAPAAAGETTRVTVPVKNIGGAAGDKEVVLYADDQVVARRKVTLQPGEEQHVVLEHRFSESGSRFLRVDDWPAWPFATFTNTQAIFSQTRDRIIIDAGGGKGKRFCNGDYVTAYIPRVEGDFVATVRMLSQKATSYASPVGLVVRNDLTRQGAESPALAIVYMEPMYGGQQAWQADVSGDGEIDSTFYGQGGYPLWFKLEKRGQELTAYTSYNSQTWVIPQVAWDNGEGAHEGVYTIPSAAAVQDVGLFSYADSVNEEMARVEFDNWRLDQPLPLNALEFSELEVSKTQVGLYEQFTTTAVVTNRSDREGPAKVGFFFNTHEPHTRWLDLKPGESQKVEFTLSPMHIKGILWLVQRDPNWIYGQHRVTIGNATPLEINVRK